MHKYLLDSNFFMHINNQMFPLSKYPAFWDIIATQMFSGKVSSILSVYNEVQERDDDISTWTKNMKDKVFFDLCENSMHNMRELSEWVMSQSKYTDVAKNEFLAKADSELIAYAAANKYTIVTNEKKSNKAHIVKIPDAAAIF